MRSNRSAALCCSWPTAILHDALDSASTAPVFAAEETTFVVTKDPAIIHSGGLAAHATLPPLPLEHAAARALSSSLSTPVTTAVMYDQFSFPRARRVNQRQTVVQPDGMHTERPQDLAVPWTSDCVSPRQAEETSSLCAQSGYNLVLPLGADVHSLPSTPVDVLTVHTTTMFSRAVDLRVSQTRTRPYRRSGALPRALRLYSYRAPPLHLLVRTQHAATLGMFRPRACFEQAQPAQYSGRTKDVLPIWFNPGIVRSINQRYGTLSVRRAVRSRVTTCAHRTVIFNVEAWFQHPQT
jgi:hypothetical protein